MQYTSQHSKNKGLGLGFWALGFYRGYNKGLQGFRKVLQCFGGFRVQV